MKLHGEDRFELLKILAPGFKKLSNQELFDLLWLGGYLYEGGKSTSGEIVRSLRSDKDKLIGYGSLNRLVKWDEGALALLLTHPNPTMRNFAENFLKKK